MDYTETIYNIFAKISPYSEIDNSTDLLDGTLDSLSLLLLISCLEEQFSISIDISKIDLEQFRTIKSINELINSYIN